MISRRLLEIRSLRMVEYFALRIMGAASHARTKGRATRVRYRGWNRLSEIRIRVEPVNNAILTTVPLKNGRIIFRYDSGNSPMRIPLAGTLMVVRRILVDILAYMAENMSNRNRKAKKAIM